jgi:urease accessory protein
MLDRPDRHELTTQTAAAELPAFVRAHGGVEVRFGRAGARTVRLDVSERGGYRARFPTTFDDTCEAVLINTGGGMTGGDRFEARIVVDPDAQAIVTTQAAEKIYRSQGPATHVSTQISVGAGARLHWLPQEAILFDRANLERTLEADIAPDATLIACESLYFGRFAMGEVLEHASLRDRWRIRRGGRLIFAEDVKLRGPINLALQRRAVAAGARAMATVLMVAPGAPAQVEAARGALAVATSECGVTGLDGMLVTRLLSADAAALRADLARFMMHLTGSALPRSWQT